MKDSFANLKCLKLLWRLEEEGHMPGNFELGTLFIEALKRKSHMRLYYFGNKYWFHWFSNMLLPDGFKTQDLWKVFGFFAIFLNVCFWWQEETQDFVQLVNFVLVIQVLL